MSELIQAYPTAFSFVLNYLAWVLLGIWAVYSLLVVYNKEIRETISNHLIIESIPGVFVTLGLFGTFTGIAFGLLKFDTSPEAIKLSIQTLLDGLKTAMFTTITGIMCSLFFGKAIKVRVYRKRIKIPDSPELSELQNISRNLLDFREQLAQSHHDALVESLKEVLEGFNEVFKGFVNDLVEKNFKELAETIGQLSEWQRQHKDDVTSLTIAYRELVENHKQFVTNTREWVDRLDEIAGQSSRLQKIINQFNDAFNEDGNLSRVIREIKQAAEDLRDATGKYSEVVDKMDKTSDSISTTGQKVDDWTNSVERVSDSAKQILEQVQLIEAINKEHVDVLVDQYTEKLQGTLKSFDGLISAYIKNIDNRVR